MIYSGTQLANNLSYEAQDLSIYPEFIAIEHPNLILEKEVAFLKMTSASKKYKIKNNILSINPDYYTQNFYLKPFFYTVFLHQNLNSCFPDPDLDGISHFWHCYNHYAHPKNKFGFNRLKKVLKGIYFNCEHKITLIEELFWLKNYAQKKKKMDGYEKKIILL